jgi:hypothetical protein
MKRRRGRPPGAGNIRHRQQDHDDCLAIAGLRLDDPALSLWQAVFWVAGLSVWRHRDARARRLHRKFSTREDRYMRLAKLERRPAPPVTANDIARMASQIEDTWRPIVQNHDEFARLARSIAAGLPRVRRNIW